MTDFEQGPEGPESRVTPQTAYTPLLRSYEGAPEIERVWERLDTTRRAPRVGVRFALAAVVLLGFGFGLGRLSQSWTVDPLAELDGRRAVAIAPERARASAAGPTVEAIVQDEKSSRSRAALGSARPRAVARPAPLPAPAVALELEEPIVPDEREESSSWALLAERGDYAGAFESLDESGDLSRLVATGSPEELMNLADVARFAGRTGRAIQILREVTSRHSEDENAPLAAMTLGNLLDRAGDFEGAARAYALCRRLAPYGDFAEDALVREFMMACGARERVRASRLLAEYASLHPSGARQEEMTAALALLGDSDPPSPDAGVDRSSSSVTDPDQP